MPDVSYMPSVGANVNPSAPVPLAVTVTGAIPPNSTDPIPGDADLIANGYEPLAVIEKRPAATEWQKRPNTVEALAAERAAHPDALSTGLRTDRMPGIDIDIFDAEHVDALQRLADEVLGVTLMERVGSKGKMLVYRNETPTRKITVASIVAGKIKPQVEILGVGRMFVAYGVHPSTKRPYIWTNAIMGAEPSRVPLDALPEVTPDKLREFARRAAALLTQLGYSDVKITDPGEHAVARECKRREDKVPVPREELVEILGYISPDCERGQWIAYVGAIQATNLRGVAPEDMDDELLDIAQTWSHGDYSNAGQPKSWKEDDWPDTYWTLDPMKAGGTTFGTLYKVAHDNGYAKRAPGAPTEEKFAAALAGVDVSTATAAANENVTAADAWHTGKRMKLVKKGGGKPVDWLWPGHLARGMFHILAGNPGAAKSTMAFNFAAILSVGGNWPDGTAAPIGNTLIWSSEDPWDYVIEPRLLACGADLSRVDGIGGIEEGGTERAFDPARDIDELLRTAAALPELRLMILDPVVSAITGDDHHNNDVRRGLAPLVEFAERRGVVVLGISHYTKNSEGKDPTERLIGSRGYGAVARVILGAAKTEDGSRRRLVRSKSNIGPEGDGFEYRVKQVPVTTAAGTFNAQRVEWGEPVSGSARSLLDELAPDRGAKEPKLDAARALILQQLSERTKSHDEMKEAAYQACIGWRTIERAREGLGGIIEIKRLGGQMWWRLAEAPAAPSQE